MTQFIRFHGFLLVDMISWILLSKNIFLAILTNFLYLVQSVLLLDVWYLVRSLLYSLFHYTLEYLVMLTFLEYLYQNSSAIEANSCVIFSSILQSWIFVILIQLILFLDLLINSFSFSLFLTIACFLSCMVSFLIIKTNKEVWSDRLWRYSKIVWLLNSFTFVWRNIRSKTEFES